MGTLVRFVGTGRCSCNQSSCHASLDSWPGHRAGLKISLSLGPGPASMDQCWASAESWFGPGPWLDSGFGLGPALAWSQIQKLNANYRLAEADRNPTGLGS